MFGIKKNARRMTAALVATAMVVTGCSRAEDAPAPEQEQDTGSNERIASLGLGDVDTLLALGITPVAIAPWGSEGDAGESGVGPWSEDLLGDAEPVQIYGTGTGFTAEIIEQVAAVEPTQIIAVNNAVDEQAQASLEEIAPLTTKPDEYPDWQVPWEAQVETIADAVDKQAEGDELIAETEQAFEDFRAAHPDLQGKTAAIVMPYDGKIGLYTSGDGRGQFIESLGFVIPESLEGDGSSFFVDYAPENYADLNELDYLFVLDYFGAVDEIKADETFQNLDIVQDGRVHYFHTDVGNAMSMPNPVTIPWAIDKFDEQLSS